MEIRGHFLPPKELLIEAEHSELHHYTGWGGLEGICASQTLYGTRYDFLNDLTEIEHFREVFSNVLASKIKPIVEREVNSKPEMSQLLSQYGDIDTLAKAGSTDFVTRIYDQTFNIADPTKGFAIPFITSFCSHEHDQMYEKKNGLLSQWRGYNAKTDERYALVFDTKKLSKKIEGESTNFDYPLYLADVKYNDDSFNYTETFQDLFEASQEKLENQLAGKDDPGASIERLFRSFILAAARFKHRGFYEEREVRLISFVQRAECIQRLYQQYNRPIPNFKYKPTFLDVGDGNKERIRLFEFDSTIPLPITRIIVGPHKNQDALYDKVTSLTGGKLDVVKSKTPYIG